MGGLLLTFRQALRSLARERSFFAVSVLTLALGVGSVSAIFSVVNGVLLKPLPYPDAERIVRIDRSQPPYGGPIARPVLDDWRDATSDVFSSMAAFTPQSMTLTGSGDAQQLVAYGVSPGFWQVMDLPAQLGRYFGEAEERDGSRVAVLGHALWRDRFGSDPGVVGRDVLLNGVAHRVVGVTPAGFRYPDGTDVYVPTYLPASALGRDTNYLLVIARLREGVDIARADAALATVNAALAQTHPGNHAGLGAEIVPLPERVVGDVREPLVVLLGASALVLLIACANLGNLLLARGSRRQRELAVRGALGAGRGDLLRVQLSEAVILAAIGGVAGVALAAVAVPLLLATAPDVLPGHAQAAMDPTVVAVSLSVALLTVLAFALWPALRASNVSPAGALQEEGRGGSAGRAGTRARSALIVAEVALSLTLLVGAGLMIESLRRLGNVDAGVDTAGVLTATVALPLPPIDGSIDFEAQYREHTQRLSARVHELVERLSAIPGVQGVAISDGLPLSGRNNISSDVEVVGGDFPADGAQQPGANWRFVNPGYFDALGVDVVAGRALDAGDERPGEWPVQVMVNETFARRFLGDDAIGREIGFLGGAKTVVGVVADTRLMGHARDPLPEVYMAIGNAVQTEFQVALKVAGDPADFAQPLRRTLADVDPDMPVRHVQPMDAMAAEGLALRRFNMHLMTVFSGVALCLAAVGLYGVIAYSVAQRQRELGIRMSLGASGARLLRMVMAQGMRVVVPGVVVGIVGALLLARTLASQLYGIGAADPGVLGSVTALLVAVAALACLFPALRAARAQPMRALRDE